MIPKLYHRQHDVILIVNGLIQSYVPINQTIAPLIAHPDQIQSVGVYAGRLFYIDTKRRLIGHSAFLGQPFCRGVSDRSGRGGFHSFLSQQGELMMWGRNDMG